MDIRENFSFLQWQQLPCGWRWRFIAYKYYAVRSKVVDKLTAIKFTGETLPSTLQFYSGRMSPSAPAGAMQRDLCASRLTFPSGP